MGPESDERPTGPYIVSESGRLGGPTPYIPLGAMRQALEMALAGPAAALLTFPRDRDA